MSDLALPGVYSNIDTGALIEAELNVARVPLNRLQNQKSSYQNKINSLQNIQSTLVQMQELASQMRGRDSLRSASASVGDSDILSASAGAGVTPGTHEVVVNQLAAAETEVHDGVTPTETWTHINTVATADSEYISADNISDNAGENYKFVFQFGDEAQVTVDLSAYDATGITLNELVSEINTAAGYTAASTVETDNGYKLQLAAQSAGDDKDFAVAADDSINNFDSTDNFTRTIAGDDEEGYIVGAGGFVYTYNGVTRTLTATEDTTLGELRDLINNDSANPGVQASILDYQVDTDHRYHLVLRGQDTGSDYSIVIESDTTLADFAPGANWTQTSAAGDSQVCVDGYPAGDWITRSGNSITDVIPGVTLNLKSTGTTSVSLTRTTGDLKQDISNLVEIYNRAATLIADDTGYDEDTKTSGIFQGDILVNTLLNGIRSVFTTSVDGFQYGSDTYTLASDLGIEIDRYGQLSFDSATFDDAISDDYIAVLDLLAARGRGVTNSDDVQFNVAGEDTTAGTYELKVDFDVAGEITGAWFRTLGQGESDWREATVSDGVVHGGADTPEEHLSVTVTEDPEQAGAEHTQQAQIRVKHGIGTRINKEIEGIIDDYDGTIQLKLDQYNARIESLDKSIDVQERRVEQRSKFLRQKYARLEDALAQLDSMQSAVAILLQQSGMGGNNNGPFNS